MTGAALPAGPVPEDLARLAETALGQVEAATGAGPVRVGLGSGRAAEAFVRALARLVDGGLPVEGVATSAATEALGARPRLREAAGHPVVTDNGNWIVDCGIEPLDDPAAYEREVRRIPGVIDTGLFLGTADTVLLAEAGAVRELRRGPPRR